MRKCLYILFAFLFLVALALVVNGASSTFPLLGKTIILDAGHPSEIKPSINRTSCSKFNL